MLNLTPHAITLRLDGQDLVIPPSGTVARVTVVPTPVKDLALPNGRTIPVVRNQSGPVNGLVRDSSGVPVPCIVSGMVLAALPPGTPNVYAPDSGSTAVRDERGQIVAVTRLIAC